MRIFGGNDEKGASGPRRRSPSLFPILQRPYRDPQQLSKTRLGQPGLLSRLGNIGHIDDAAKLAALDFAKAMQDFLADLALISNYITPF